VLLYFAIFVDEVCRLCIIVVQSSMLIKCAGEMSTSPFVALKALA
jgi:hypothetical protein